MRAISVRQVLALILLLSFSLSALPDVISGVSVTTNVGTASPVWGADLQSIANGNGLSSLTLEAVHGNAPAAMWYSDSKNDATLWFDLGGVFELKRIGIWRYNTLFDPDAIVRSFDV